MASQLLLGFWQLSRHFLAWHSIETSSYHLLTSHIWFMVILVLRTVGFYWVTSWDCKCETSWTCRPLKLYFSATNSTIFTFPIKRKKWKCSIIFTLSNKSYMVQCTSILSPILNGNIFDFVLYMTQYTNFFAVHFINYFVGKLIRFSLNAKCVNSLSHVTMHWNCI